jgi:hypothetical protein
MREWQKGLWHWTASHPDWKPGEDWEPEVSSYAIDDGERLQLLDPLAPPLINRGPPRGGPRCLIARSAQDRGGVAWMVAAEGAGDVADSCAARPVRRQVNRRRVRGMLAERARLGAREIGSRLAPTVRILLPVSHGGRCRREGEGADPENKPQSLHFSPPFWVRLSRSLRATQTKFA